MTKTNGECSSRVRRGGSWDSALYARVAGRFNDGPGSRYDILGFRLSREITVLQRLAEGEKDDKNQ